MNRLICWLRGKHPWWLDHDNLWGERQADGTIVYYPTKECRRCGTTREER